jgi:hypothetical protein
MHNHVLRESGASCNLPVKLCLDTPVVLDAPVARSSATKPRGVSIGVECVKFVELIWGFILEGVDHLWC